MVITPLSKYQIAKTKTFEKVKKKIDNFEGYYRYRIGNYRLFYLIENNKRECKSNCVNPPFILKSLSIF